MESCGISVAAFARLVTIPGSVSESSRINIPRKASQPNQKMKSWCLTRTHKARLPPQIEPFD